METMTEATPPILTIEGRRATIRLNRPKQHNRIEPADLAALIAHMKAIEAEPDLRVVVITGTGKSFSAGYHLGDLGNGGEVADAGEKPSFEAMVDAVENCRLPVICALNGGVYGGSTDLALACDFRIGVMGMEMFMPAARLGIAYYPSGMVRYVSRLGLNAAKRLFLTAETLGAEELLSIGYLTELVPKDELAAATDALAERLSAMAPLAVQGMKRSLNEIAHGRFDVEGALTRAAATQASEDLREGLAAFREKRPPVFQGR
ncbi:MAG: enoyl-CoA hydratase/isomerase family protein [Acetobacteraceae bacterium]|nr:enoyl-CoA hydratase/isomerase family protein [Acetobacteraceae bacterium]